MNKESNQATSKTSANRTAFEGGARKPHGRASDGLHRRDGSLRVRPRVVPQASPAPHAPAHTAEDVEQRLARCEEQAAALFAYQYVAGAFKAAALGDADEYLNLVRNFVVRGFERRGVLIGQNGHLVGGLVHGEIDLERTRRRAMAIACDELRTAIAACRTRVDETLDSVDSLDGAFSDLEITAWVAGAVDRYEDSVGLFLVIGQVNPLTRVVTKLPYRADDGGPSSGGGLLDHTLFRIGGVHLDRAVAQPPERPHKAGW